MGPSPEQINIKAIQGNLASITEERSQLKEAMLSITKETKEMEKKLNLIQQYLGYGSKNQGIKKRTGDIQLLMPALYKKRLSRTMADAYSGNGLVIIGYAKRAGI